MELAVQVTTSNLSDAADNVPPPIHTHAARKIIQDLQDGHYDASLHVDSSILQQTVAAHIVRFGKAYLIASRPLLSQLTSLVRLTLSTVNISIQRPFATEGFTTILWIHLAI